MALETGTQGASTSRRRPASRASTPPVEPPSVTTAASSGKGLTSNLNNRFPSWAIAVFAFISFGFLVIASVNTLGLITSMSIHYNIPLFTNNNLSALNGDMPLKAIGYMNTEQGGPIVHMVDKEMGCEYFVIPNGDIIARNDEFGNQICARTPK